MLGYILLLLLFFILLIDSPRFKGNTATRKAIRLVFLVIGFLHGYLGWTGSQGLNANLSSGILLFGLFLIYTATTNHKGIEDKVARKTFKNISWFLIWIIAIIHVIVSFE